MTTWLESFKKASKAVASFSKQLSAFAIAGTVVGYWITYQDKIEERQAHAWATLREALKWSASGNWGNVGHITAIQALTRHCDSWWRDGWFRPVFGLFFQDCVPLKSLDLRRMDNGQLRASGADLSSSNLSCANFVGADLRRANLQRVDFRGSKLIGADLRGADLTQSISLKLVDLSWAKMDDKTQIEEVSLKCACITAETKDGKFVRHEFDTKSSKLKQIASKMKICPAELDWCSDAVMNSWTCAD